jgi:Tol biopolymer transport system component
MLAAAGLLAGVVLAPPSSASPGAAAAAVRTSGVPSAVSVSRTTAASAVPAVTSGLTSSRHHGLIAFSSGFILNFPDTDNPSQVFTVRPDGSDERQLTHVPDGKQAGAPDLSEDGRRIVYVSNVDGNFAVWVMRSDGTHQHRLFGHTGYDFFQPRWSPDRRHLLVSRCNVSFGFVSNCDVVIAHADGSHRRTLVGGGRYSGNATFSPNGRWIAFDSDRGGYVSTVWKMRLPSGRPVRLTRADLEAFWPSWSPDGSHLLVSDNCCRPGSNVWRMRADGSHLRRLTDVPGGGGAAFASYSPNGRQIVFSSDQLRGPDFTSGDLFVMHTDGSHVRRIVDDQAQAIGGDWEREGR